MNDTMSIAQYAQEILNGFSTPIALDRMDSLVYMTVGAGRLKLLNDLTNRMHKHLKLGESKPHSGMYFEVVLGEYGAGKSHLGYMLKHNALTSGSELLVAHVQITGEPQFQAVLASLLRSLRIAGVPSWSDNEIELSAYQKLYQWCGSNGKELFKLADQARGNLRSAAASDFARAVSLCAGPNCNASPMQQFIDAWIRREDSKTALLCFEMIFRLFSTLKSDRCILIVDEFEAMQSAEANERIRILQSFQDMHDDLAGRAHGLPACHMVCFSTKDWSERAANILPSLLGPGNRVKKTSAIPDVDDFDIGALLYRYLGLLQLTSVGDNVPQRDEIEKATTDILAQVTNSKHHMRSIHSLVRAKAEEVLTATKYMPRTGSTK